MQQNYFGPVEVRFSVMFFTQSYPSTVSSPPVLFHHLTRSTHPFTLPAFPGVSLPPPPGGSESSWDKEKLQSPPSSGIGHLGLGPASLAAHHGLSSAHLSSLQQNHLLANRESLWLSEPLSPWPPYRPLLPHSPAHSLAHSLVLFIPSLCLFFTSWPTIGSSGLRFANLYHFIFFSSLTYSCIHSLPTSLPPFLTHSLPHSIPPFLTHLFFSLIPSCCLFFSTFHLNATSYFILRLFSSSPPCSFLQFHSTHWVGLRTSLELRIKVYH